MKRRIGIGVALWIAGGTGPAWASAQGVYVSGQGGVSYLPDLQMRSGTARATDSFQMGRILGTAIGYDNGNGWRYELDWTHQTSDIDRFNGLPESGHLWSMGVMANVIYDLTQGTTLTPYVGGGVGVEWVGGSVHGFSGRAWRPAYQLRAGMRCDLAQQTALFVEYRFAQSQAVKLTEAPAVANQHFTDHALMVGIAFRTGIGGQEPVERVARYLELVFRDGENEI